MTPSRRTRQAPIVAPEPEPEPAAQALPESGYVIATEPLFTRGGALAAVPGDRVPAENVARNGWEGSVMPLPQPPGHYTAPETLEASPEAHSDGGTGLPATP